MLPKPKTGALWDGFPAFSDFRLFWGTPFFSYFSPNFRQARGAFQIAVSRARAVKNILAGPDASGGPTEASGPARMFFWDRVREGAELVTG